jgi:IMP cyclohydrolase
MSQPLESLAKMEYPGRALAVGRDLTGAFNVVIYAVTGRSPSSQARRLELDANAIWTKPTDPEVLRKGNPDLLIYPAVILSESMAVSNGRQTSDIAARSGQNPVQVLDEALKNWEYEPDSPIFTPRISGCILPSGRAGLSLIKRAENGTSLRFFFEVALIPGKGKLLTTYSGKNKDPLQSYIGEPLDLGLREPTAQALAEAVDRALKPRGKEVDVRVAVACIFALASNMKDHQVFIINCREGKRP